MTMTRLARSAGLFITTAVLATGCGSLFDAFDPDAEPTEPETIGVMTISVGDCLNEPTEDGSIEEVTQVPCAEPHDLEAYYAFDLEGDTIPVGEAMTDRAEGGCLAQFEGFVGTPYEDSELYLYTFYPTPQSWSSGDREVLCLVQEPDVKLTGTMRNSNR